MHRHKTATEHLLLNNTPITWGFLIKAPYLGKVGVIYDAENKVLAMVKRSYD